MNREVDYDDMSYAQKAMIRFHMALGIDGIWIFNQLFPHLQELIAKHESYFHGQHVSL